MSYNIGRASNNILTGFTTQCQVLLYKLYSIHQNDCIINYFFYILHFHKNVLPLLLLSTWPKNITLWP